MTFLVAIFELLRTVEGRKILGKWLIHWKLQNRTIYKIFWKTNFLHTQNQHPGQRGIIHNMVFRKTINFPLSQSLPLPLPPRPVMPCEWMENEKRSNSHLHIFLEFIFIKFISISTWGNVERDEEASEAARPSVEHRVAL